MLAGSLPAGIPTSADLSVTKTCSNCPEPAGASISYIVSLTNGGPDDAQNVTLTDAVPTNTTFVSAMQTNGPAFTLSTPPVGGTGTITGTLVTLAAGASATFQFTINVNASFTGTTITNTATAASTTPDPNLGNNSATVTSTGGVVAQLSVTKTDGVSTVTAGANTTYAVLLTNNGPSDAQNVTLTDPVPANTAFVSAMQTNGPAFTLSTPPVGGTGTITGTLATLAAGASATFQFTINVNASTLNGTTITNTATAASTTFDINPADNSATDTDTVGPPPGATVPMLSEPGVALLGLGLALAALAVLRQR